MNRVTEAIKSRVSNTFASMFSNVLPERTKRLMFFASFTAQLKDPSEIDDEMLHKLNELLELSADDAALKLPMHLSHAIWRNRPLAEGVRSSLERTDTLQSRVAVSLGQRVMDAMPSWMRYADESRMQADIEKLLRWQHGKPSCTVA